MRKKEREKDKGSEEKERKDARSRERGDKPDSYI